MGIEMPIRSNTLNYVCKSSRKWILNETERISYKIDKYFTVIRGYNKIRPRILPKKLTSFLPYVVKQDDHIDLYESHSTAPRTRSSSLSLRHKKEPKPLQSSGSLPSNKYKKPAEPVFAITKDRKFNCKHTTASQTDSTLLITRAETVQTPPKTPRMKRHNQLKQHSQRNRTHDANGVLLPEVITTYNNDLFAYCPNSHERVEV